jgi:lysophospholipase L1-like esterase
MDAPAPRARRGWLVAVALAVWFVLAPLVCCEVALRMASHAGILLFDVEMWRYAREVKRPSVRPGVVLEHRPDAEAKLMGVRVRTDAHGFRRAAPDLEAQRTGQEPVLAIVGDSCALGWGVAEGETVSDQLERRLNTAGGPRFVVINAGVGNSNTSMEYARYLQDVRPLHPVWVVLAFFVNDAEPDPRAVDPPLLERSVLLAMLATRAPTLLFPAYRNYHGYYESLYAPESAALQRFQSALKGFGEALRADGVPGSVLLIPEMHEPRHFGPFAGVYRQVAALAAESGFEVIDPSDEFAPGSGEGYWVTRGDPHPNGKAHAILAAALAGSRHARRLVAPAS